MVSGAGPERAAAAVVRSPLRWHEEDTTAASTVIAERGWFQGAAECARHLAGLSGGQVSVARGFGGQWPVIHGPDWMVAPAVPLVVAGRGGDGVDAGYFVRGKEIWREASGSERRLLVLGDEGACPGKPFDLLWFGDNDRWVFRNGVLSVEDLFSVVEVAADRTVLERLLIRGRRVEPAILNGLHHNQRPEAARITVHRARALGAPGRWRDIERFFLARADVERTERHGDRLMIETVRGERARFVCSEDVNGWIARLDAGSYPVVGFSIRNRRGTLALSAVLDPGLDPLAPGVRGRLAFDLRSDLVTLG